MVLELHINRIFLIMKNIYQSFSLDLFMQMREKGKVGLWDHWYSS